MNKHGINLTVILLSVALFFSMYATAIMFIQKDYYTNGSILSINVDLFWNEEMTLPVTNMAWFHIEVGATKYMEFIVANTGTTNLTLSLTTHDWLPEIAEDFIQVSWDQENMVLLKGEWVRAKVTISVSSSIVDVDEFSYTTTIIGTEIMGETPTGSAMATDNYPPQNVGDRYNRGGSSNTEEAIINGTFSET